LTNGNLQASTREDNRPLQLLLPATVATAERSFSVIKSLKTYLGCTMTQRSPGPLAAFNGREKKGKRGDGRD